MVGTADKAFGTLAPFRDCESIPGRVDQRMGVCGDHEVARAEPARPNSVVSLMPL